MTHRLVPRLACPAVLLLASALSADAEWWHDAWRCRRAVVFGEEASAAVFVLSVPTHGRHAEAGRDVRVVVDGKAVPARVLGVDPGDEVRVAFERRGQATHYVYWDNPAARPSPPADLRAGVLFEARSYDGSAVNSLDEMHARWAAAPSQGRRYVDAVHLAHNPLGPSENFLSRFVAYLRVPADGRYTFATDSDDASFLLVDGRLAAQWPGLHRASGYGRHNGTVRLEAGVHRLEYLHAQAGDRLLMNAAWQPPGAKYPVVIPADAFVPVGRASVGRIETAVGPPACDFIATNTGQAVLDPDANHFIIRVHFENLVDAGTLETHSVRWFFGDGTTSTEVSPDHVYLMPGVYEVALVLVKGYDEQKLTTKVAALRDWDRQPKSIDIRETYYPIVRTYDIARMEPRHAYLAMYYFGRTAKRDDVIRAGKVILSRGPTLPEETLFDAVQLYAETMRVEGEDFEAAKKMLLSYEGRMKRVEHKAALALAAGDIDMWHRKDLDSAEAHYRRVITTYAEEARRLTLRKALVRMGDIYRWRHDGLRAREFLHKAQSIPVDERGPVQRAVRAGFLARSIETFLEKGDMEFAYEYLVTWAWEFPEDQLEGYWTELRVKWLIKNKEYPGGVAEVESLLKMNPKTPYAPSLLWLAADCAEATGDLAKAKALLGRILTDYPEALNKKAVLARLEAMK
jgi:tetratricopeptide (TPR) repeat protein